MRKPKIFKSPRREALAALREIKTRTMWLIEQWDVPSTVHVRFNQPRRKREDSEYPENQQDSWMELRLQTEALIQQAQELQNFAIQQLRDLKQRQSS